MKGILRLRVPAAVMAGVFLVHYGWFVLYSPQARWMSLGGGASFLRFRPYLEAQGPWVAWSYGISLAFMAVAFRRYLETRACGPGVVTIGSLTFTGMLSVFICFLAGCCGSPMLAVYLNLFGASFLPLARPLIAILTTASVVLAWIWMNRRLRLATSCSNACSGLSRVNSKIPPPRLHNLL